MKLLKRLALKIPLFIISGAAAFVFLSSPALASYEDQTDSSTSTGLTTGQWFQILSNASATFQGTFNSVQIKAIPNSTSSPTTNAIVAQLRQRTDCVDYESNPIAYSGAGSVLHMIQTNTITTTGTAQFITFASSSNYTTLPTECYDLRIDTPVGGQNLELLGSPDPDSHEGFLINAGGTTLLDAKDMYFRFGTGDFTAFLSAARLQFPEDDSLISQDFSSFHVRANYAFVDGDTRIRVRYGVSPALEFYDETEFTSSTPLIASEMLFIVPKSIALTAGYTYYARAEIWHEGVQEAVGDIHEFTILDPTDGVIGYIDIQPFTEDISSLFPIDDCSSFIGSIFSSSTLEALGCVSKNVLKDVLVFFFKPSEFTTDFVQDTFNKFQSVFPFSIFFKTQAIVEQAIDDQAAADPLTLNLNVTVGSSTSSSFPIALQFYDAGIISDTYGEGIREFWYNTVIMLWIIFCFSVVVKHAINHL
jgi:hypothetical protein